MTITREDISAIVEAVGDRHTPADIDCDALRDELDRSHTHYETAVYYSTNRPASDRWEKTEKVLKAAKRLELLLRDDGVCSDISAGMPLEWADPRKAVEGIIEAAEIALHPSRTQGIATAPLAEGFMGIDVWSPFEWLVGEHLPRIFEKHFSAKASHGVNNGAPNSPYLRFVYEALIALEITNKGKPYSMAWIGDARKRVKAGKSRRANKGAN